jgi:non-heme chloroperoxidase
MPYIRTADGTRLFYIDAGIGQPVLFVASAWLSSKMWEFQIPYFVDRGFRCIACDRRGHGRSDVPWNGYDYDTLSDDLASLVEALDLREVTLVSHSAGAGEIVRYLTRHGAARVKRVAMVSGLTPFPMKSDDNPDGIDRSLMEADLAVRTVDRPKWFSEHADDFFGVGLPGIRVSPEFVQFMIGQCLECSFRATLAFFLTGFTTDLRSEMRTITVPTLIVHGDHDVQAPIQICGAKAAQLVRHSTFLIYENAAHGMFVTHADRLNNDLLRFLQA